MLSCDLGSWADALAPLRRAVEIGNWDWSLLRLWVARARMGERDAASKDLRSQLKSARTGKRPLPGTMDDWIEQIARFLMGEAKEEQILRAADLPGEKDPGGKTCEACFYVGVRRLLDGDRPGALEFFRKCVRADKRGFTEHQSSLFEIQELLFGVRMMPLTEGARGGLSLKAGVGLSVVHVAKGGPAEKAGIREDDVLASLGGKEATWQELRRLLDQGKIGETLPVELLRQKQKQAVELTLGVWK